MQESILRSIAKLIGIGEDYEAFDVDLIICINSAFTVLSQLGVGPKEPFSIESENETWSDFFSVGCHAPIHLVKTYMKNKVKMEFDPPTVGVLHEALERQIQESEWRLNIEAEGASETDEWT